MAKRLSVILFSVILVAAFSSALSAADYLGVKKCKACHIKQYKSWEKTNMANSFENLKAGAKADAKKKAGLDPAKDYTSDVKCLKCHTTGYGKPGGFESVKKTPHLINVQCEGCHGPGADFREIMKKNKQFKLSEVQTAGLILPGESANNCADCHNDESPFNEKVDAEYQFDIKDRLKKTHEHYPLKYEH